jgi:hypothetical protein
MRAERKQERKRQAHLEQTFRLAVQKAYKTAERKGEPINIEGLKNIARNLGLTDTPTVAPPTKREGRERIREAEAAGRR